MLSTFKVIILYSGTKEMARKSSFIPTIYTNMTEHTLLYVNAVLCCDPKGFIDCMTNFFRYYWFLLDRYKVTL